MAAATLLPPLRPRAMMCGTGELEDELLALHHVHEPDRHADDQRGRRAFPLRMRSCSAISAVGALPMAKMQGFPGSCAAFSMETNRPRDAALPSPPAATSASDMKQCTSPPRRAEDRFVDARFRHLRVRDDVAARCGARRVTFVTACGENTRLSAHSQNPRSCG